MNPTVFVIVLNWNNYTDTAECIKTVERSTYKQIQVVIVDNFSTDGSAARLKVDFPNCTFIQSEQNLGFAAGNNLGITHALMHGADYVLLLNNDTIAKDTFLEPAIEAAEHNKKIGIVGGKIYYYPQRTRIWYAGAELRMGLFKFRGPSIVHSRNNTDLAQSEVNRIVTYVPGALMLIRRSVFEAVGLLPETYFFRMEDVDFCFNVRRKGYFLLYVPEFVVWHKIQGGNRKFDPKYIYNDYRNKINFQEINFSKVHCLAWKQLYRIYYRFIAPHLFRRWHGETGDLMAKLAILAMNDHTTSAKVVADDLQRIQCLFSQGA